MSAEEPVRLLFDPSMIVAGQVLEGAVDLYWPIVIEKKIEEVIVKLRGELRTRFERRTVHNVNGRNQPYYRTESQSVDLIRDDIVLWDQNSGIAPPPDSPILRLPFRIQLPEDLPPSCDIGSYSKYGKVGYYLEAVGKRPGLHFNKKDLVPFPLLPSSSLGAQLKDVLEQGWHGPWKIFDQGDEIRRGIWGEHAHVKVTLALPDIEVLPMFASIPVSINIVTVSKHMHLDDTPKDEPIFPAPPTKPGEVELVLKRDMFLKAHGWAESSTGVDVQNLGGLGEELSLDQYSRVQVRPFENVWIPGEKDKGQWKQEATITTWFRLTSPPTFDTSHMSISYYLRLKVDFPGMGNDTKFEVPLRIASSLYAPRHMGWGNAPAPQMELPLSYFEAGSWQSEKE
ncbi:hypothetical protein BDY19DRAFT_994662 [Irpex rosettiformis]|uniref:Uncharacterized protein n=1 Tax=Irpex rosettiformis TaxID=378272 RepID=A0ACB8U091_9APHY|nr:hypothetical protein BDY19DRAFT_994662 [Irpex rosettiformis]